MSATEQANLGDFGRDLSDLSTAEKTVYRLVEDDDLTPTAVADRTTWEYSTVTTLLYRARRKRGESPQI